MKGGRSSIGSVTIRVLPETRIFDLVVLDIMGVESYELLKIISPVFKCGNDEKGSVTIYKGIKVKKGMGTL
ncbi:MAG TPA: hypothetical protein HPP41_04575 [Deltaproteobacteria bacterium]|nr:hypothetical protein [Deltaproteobacteria bacterium]